MCELGLDDPNVFAMASNHCRLFVAHDARRLTARNGLTLVELLVVMAVLGTLVGLLLPAIQAAREAARRSGCANQLRQLGLGLVNYESVHGTFPIGCVECYYRLPPPRRQLAWTVPLLPFIEQQAVADRYHTEQRFDASANLAAAGTVISTFLCPSTHRTERQGPTTGDINGDGDWDPGDDVAYTDYGGLYGVSFDTLEILPEHEGVMVYERAIAPRQISDGLSRTAVVGECAGRTHVWDSQWANGKNLFDQTYNNPINESQDNELWSDHPGGVQLTFCDAHVAFLSEAVDQAIVLSLLTRQGGDSP